MRAPVEKLTELAMAARAVAARAYCPYSGFPVGAAVLTKSGRIFAAPNIENASYSVTICAERNAAAQAVAAGEREILAIALYTATPEPSTPCGTCRQFLNEFNPAMGVHCVSDGDREIHCTLEELLPLGFRLAPAGE